MMSYTDMMPNYINSYKAKIRFAQTEQSFYIHRMNVRLRIPIDLDTRSRVIEYAIELFVKQGLQQTSMAQLSEESGIAVGTIYYYFESKNDLIEKTYLYISEKYGVAVKAGEDEYKLPYKKQFKNIWLKSCAFFIDNPSYFYLKDSLQYSPLISNELRSKSQQYYKAGHELIKKGIELGIIPDNDPLILGAWIYNTIITPAQLHLGGIVTMTPNVLEDFFEMSWKGITTDNHNKP